MKKEEIDFMSNLSAAMLERNRHGTRILVNVVFVTIIWLIVWAYFAKLDEITRGMGKIVPSSQVQVLQNLEGGIVAEIMVKTGDSVEKDQPLIRIDNKKFESSYAESRLKLEEYRIREARLIAEANGATFEVETSLEKLSPDFFKNEKILFDTNMGYLANQIKMVRQQIEQKNNEIAEAKTVISNLEQNRDLLSQQISITRPLVERGVAAKTDMIRLEREMSGLREKLDSMRFSIPKSENGIRELESRIEDMRISFKSRAQKELSEVIGQISQNKESQNSLKDQVVRTMIKSPVKGIVKQLFVNTIGGVVRPGMDIIEIVPVDDKLLVEAQVRPNDIAFIHPGQDAMVKVTAYDYSIHGGLNGKVKSISADTITDNRGQSYFLVKIETDKNFLGTSEKSLKIIPGMTVTVDILTGKKTVMNYIMKPIMKAKNEALTER